MSKTRIRWATHSDNAASGCSEPRDADGVMDPACVNCYARLQSARCASMGQALYGGVAERRGGGAAWTGVFRWSPELLRKRFDAMRAGMRDFFGSMTDLFHAEHDPALLRDLAENIRRLDVGLPSRRPDALILLTKRPERLLDWQAQEFPFGLPAWVWPGVTAVTQAWVDRRVPILLQVYARVLVLSAEPLMGRIDVRGYVEPDFVQRAAGRLSRARFPLSGDARRGRLGWIIAGGESGRVVVAFGDFSFARKDPRAELQRQARAIVADLHTAGIPTYALGTTAKGWPRHPLYLRNDATLSPWAPPGGAS